MKKSIAGFTLIEVIVALTIIAIALAALIKASGNHTYSASYLKSKTLAHYVAMNEVARLTIEKKWPDLGVTHKSTEMAGIEWYWTRTVEKTADDTGKIRSVKYTVFLDEDLKQNLTSLQAYITRPEADSSPGSSPGPSSSSNPSPTK